MAILTLGNTKRRTPRDCRRCDNGLGGSACAEVFAESAKIAPCD